MSAGCCGPATRWSPGVRCSSPTSPPRRWRGPGPAPWSEERPSTATTGPTAHRVVATVGLLVGLQGLMVIRYGQAPIPVRYFLPAKVFRLFGVNVRYEQLIVFVLALVAAVALSRFLSATRIGVAMQGVVNDPSLLALQGISPIAVRRSAWMIGSCFAALSGALMAPSLGLDATLLTLLVVQAFGAAAIGRFSSLPLTYLGGL